MCPNLLQKYHATTQCDEAQSNVGVTSKTTILRIDVKKFMLDLHKKSTGRGKERRDKAVADRVDQQNSGEAVSRLIVSFVCTPLLN